RARRVHDDRAVDVATTILWRKHDEAAFDGDGQRLHLLLPPGRQMAGSRVLLREPGRQRAIPRLVVLANDPDVLLAEVAARVAVTIATVVVVAVPVRVPMLV